MSLNPAILKSIDFSSVDCEIGKHRISIDENHYLIIGIASDDVGADFHWNLKWAPDHGQRPHGFTGAAIKVCRDRGEALWFEPERDGHTVYIDKETIRVVKTAIEHGYAYVCLTLYGPATDAYGATHFVDIASVSCGAIDWDAGYIQSILTELAHEVADQIADRNSKVLTA
jgi:hypothetical protein